MRQSAPRNQANRGTERSAEPSEPRNRANGARAIHGTEQTTKPSALLSQSQRSDMRLTMEFGITFHPALPRRDAATTQGCRDYAGIPTKNNVGIVFHDHENQNGGAWGPIQGQKGSLAKSTALHYHTGIPRLRKDNDQI